MKNFYNIFLIAIIFVLCTVGCSAQSNASDQPTITKNSDSEYEKTFTDLNLGIIFNFDFYLPHADERWVHLWVERYRNGEKDAEPVSQLSYGISPNEVEEGALGFGMINHETENPLLFLYGPGMRTTPETMDKEPGKRIMAPDYAIGEEEIGIELGEEILLAAYREKEGTSIRTGDFQDEESINRMIEEGDTLFLLKLMVEEEDSVSNK